MATQAGSTSTPKRVTEANFERAESDMYFGVRVKESGIGKLYHYREVMPIEKQTVIRANRDTLYSSGVFDLDAGPVTVTLPNPGNRFMSLMVIDEDQYNPTTVYAPGTVTFSRDRSDTRYLMLAVRTFIDPSDPADADRVHALQDAIKVEQPKAGAWEVPAWDAGSQKAIRDELIKRSASIPDSKRMFGARGQVDPERHLIGTATGWGGNSEENAMYLNVTPPKNDGTTVHRLTIKKDVPVDGFWSISVYGEGGYFHENRQHSYSINNVTAKKDADGTVTIQFGGCNGSAANCLPITKGWSYWVRLYRPRKEILDGTFKFPEAQPVR